MKILVLSDLHIEFRAPQPHRVCQLCGDRYGLEPWHSWVWPANPGSETFGLCEVCGSEAHLASPIDCGSLGNDWNLHLPDPSRYDVAILAGDIHFGRKSIAWVAKTFPRSKDLVLLPGNHEFYGEHLNRLRLDLHDEVKQYPNIQLLDESSWQCGNVRFIGSTLWTDFRLLGSALADIERAMQESKRRITDFRTIRFGSAGWMTPGDSVKLHLVAVEYLQSQLATPFAGKTVVVTHHLPSMRSVSERYKQELTSCAFASNLDFLVEQADYWVHGHTHDSFDYTLGKCRVLCNPRGYPINRMTGAYENPEFDSQLIVEVP
ncbi:MAG: metallophosphoesterase [Candidatus Competibacter phosphatis]